MELLNSTKMVAGYTMGMDRDGRESLVVVVKGTFAIPSNGRDATLAEEQEPLVMADVYLDEPGLSAILYESDYAPRKPRCDVLLNGSAHAPGGRPTDLVPVSLKVGSLAKSFSVIGNRVWLSTIGSFTPSRPQPFQTMPISYGNAFGGIDMSHKDPAKHQAYMDNPIGVGFHCNLDAEAVEGKPLPNTEEAGNRISRPDAVYRPMSFGSCGRNFQARIDLAGAYDQMWLDDIFPFLPADFNEAYFQSAPLDQQMNYLRGGEEVVLDNLTPNGRTAFRLPNLEVPVVFFRKKGERFETKAVADTLIMEPDKGRVMILWRASLPLKKNMFEIPQVLVGTMSRAWWRARELGKTYYRSLEELSKSKRREASGESE